MNNTALHISKNQNKIRIEQKYFEFVKTSYNEVNNCKHCYFLEKYCEGIPCTDRKDNVSGYFKEIIKKRGAAQKINRYCDNKFCLPKVPGH